MAKETKKYETDGAPDTARVYERAKPEAESGMGNLENAGDQRAVRPDRMDQAVTHKQGVRQLNAEDTLDRSHAPKKDPSEVKPPPIPQVLTPQNKTTANKLHLKRDDE